MRYGLFATEEDAYRFLNWYADRYDIPDTTHFELYSADPRHEGFGRKHAVEQDGAGKEVDERPLPQASFDDFRGFRWVIRWCIGERYGTRDPGLRPHLRDEHG